MEAHISCLLLAKFPPDNTVLSLVEQKEEEIAFVSGILSYCKHTFTSWHCHREAGQGKEVGGVVILLNIKRVAELPTGFARKEKPPGY